jgi:hypothetical protein
MPFFFPFKFSPTSDKRIVYSVFSANSTNFVKILKKNHQNFKPENWPTNLMLESL